MDLNFLNIHVSTGIVQQKDENLKLKLINCIFKKAVKRKHRCGNMLFEKFYYIYMFFSGFFSN